eukprot:6108518-Amphidinium_carterae.1
MRHLSIYIIVLRSRAIRSSPSAPHKEPRLRRTTRQTRQGSVIGLHPRRPSVNKPLTVSQGTNSSMEESYPSKADNGAQSIWKSSQPDSQARYHNLVVAIEWRLFEDADIAIDLGSTPVRN